MPIPDSKVLLLSGGMDVVWQEFLKIAGLGFVFFIASLALFRRSITIST